MYAVLQWLVSARVSRSLSGARRIKSDPLPDPYLRKITFSEWNEETFVYGHFAMVVPTRHAIFPNAWEYLEVRKDKHHF